MWRKQPRLPAILSEHPPEQKRFFPEKGHKNQHECETRMQWGLRWGLTIHLASLKGFTALQNLVSRVVQSLHNNHMQMSIIEVFICRRLHMNTSMILICIWLICRLCTTLLTKFCSAVISPLFRVQHPVLATTPHPWPEISF